jgi:hypothetical protein
MHLLLRRSQRDDGWISTSMMFLLDARIDLTAEEHDLFEKYQLHDLVVYDSEPRTHHGDAAYDHFGKATEVPVWNPSFYDLATSLWNSALGTAHGLLTYLSLRITLGDLLDGQHIESEDLDQILIAEENIATAAKYMSDYFNVALTFDGAEELRDY